MAAKFIGRQRELGSLKRELLGTGVKALGISGTAGIGKTALAQKFIFDHQDQFPDGIVQMHATFLGTLLQSVKANWTRPNPPGLILIDDVDTRPQNSIQSEIREVRTTYPSARVLVLSRSAAGGSSLDRSLQISGLSREEFSAFGDGLLALADDARQQQEMFEVTAGNPGTASFLLALSAQQSKTPAEIIQTLREFKNRPGILDSDGQPMSIGAKMDSRIITDITFVDSELMRRVHANPKLLYELPPRTFEELIAEVFTMRGYDVTLTRETRDGGKDIYAAKKDNGFTFLFIVECKRYAEDNLVGVGVVRALSGVVHAERATAGIVATTSSFTKDAIEFRQSLQYQLGLVNYHGLQGWLEEAMRMRPNRGR